MRATRGARSHHMRATELCDDRGVRFVGALLVVTAAGCLSKPSSTAAMHDDGGGNGSDAVSVLDGTATSVGDGGNVVDAQARLPSCAVGTPVLFEGFDGNATGVAACGPGLLSINNAIAQQTGGDLAFRPSSTGSTADCSYQPFPDNITPLLGVIVHVTSALAGTSDTTYAQLYAGTESVAFRMTVSSMSGTQLFFYNAGGLGTAASSTAMPMYWRFTFVNATHVSGDISADGQTWEPVLTNALISGGTARVLLGMVSMTGVSPPAAEFDALYYCK